MLLRLIEDPFSSDAENLPVALQMEVTELQSSSVYQNKHGEGSLLEFRSTLDVTKFKNVIDSDVQVVVCLGEHTYASRPFP
jgi:hypothetical protein